MTSEVCTVAETATRNLLVKTETLGCFLNLQNCPECAGGRTLKKGTTNKKGIAVEILQTPKSRDKTTAVKFCGANVPHIYCRDPRIPKELKTV